MQSNKFEIKRGMVFNLNEPGRMQKNVSIDAVRKSRPYMVLSNNAVNNTGGYIHVAPMTSQVKDEKYYRVQLPHAESWVNISDIMLIPRQMCNQSNLNGYLSALSMNDAFLETLNKAIMRHFGIPEYPIVSTPRAESVVQEQPKDEPVVEQEVKPVAESIAESVTKEVEKATAPMFNLPISISISIPGYTTQSMTLTPVGESAPVSEPVAPEQSKSESSEQLTPELAYKLARQFGGSMTLQQIADKYNSTIGKVYYMCQKWDATLRKQKSVTKKAVKKQPEKPVTTTTTSPKSSKHPPNYVYITEEQIKQCRALGGPKTHAEVASELHCSTRTISDRIRAFREAHPDAKREQSSGSVVEATTKPSVGGRELIVIEDSILKKTKAFGGSLSVSEVARILGINVSTVYRRIHDIKNGVTGDCKLSDDAIREYILTNGSMFGGSMDTNELSKKLNMFAHNVEGWIYRLRKDGSVAKKPETVVSDKPSKYKFMTLDIKKQFVADCNSGRYSVAQLLAKYGSYGISSSEHLIKILRRMEKELATVKK